MGVADDRQTRCGRFEEDETETLRIAVSRRLRRRHEDSRLGEHGAHFIRTLVPQKIDVEVVIDSESTQLFLQWFVNEQVEEEANVAEIIDRIRMTGDRPGSILYLDKEAGKRAG